MKNDHELHLGSFDIGNENVQVYATKAIGGEFVTNPVPCIWIGVGASWELACETLLHEAAEFASLRLGARFTPDDNPAPDCGSFTFIMDHAKFSNLCSRVSRFEISAKPYLKKAWESLHNPRSRGKLSMK